MTDPLLVSIVTPSLNQGKFLRQAVESVLNQSYPALEYLVIDGGSTDETLDVLRSYGSRLRWLSEPDGGQSQAVNKGWRLAEGEILGWLNADDLLAPQAVARAAQTLAAHPELAGMYGDCVYIDSAGKPLRRYPAQPFDYLRLALETENFIPQPSIFLRRRWLEQVGGLDESLHYVMDYDLWLRLGLLAPLAYVPQEFSRARLHGDAKTVALAARFGPEFAHVFERLAQQALPPALEARRQEMLCNAYIHSASFCFWGGATRLAREYLAKAWRLNPFPRQRAFWRLGFFSLGGRLGWRLAEALHGNPFQPRGTA